MSSTTHQDIELSEHAAKIAVMLEHPFNTKSNTMAWRAIYYRDGDGMVCAKLFRTQGQQMGLRVSWAHTLLVYNAPEEIADAYEIAAYLGLHTVSPDDVEWVYQKPTHYIDVVRGSLPFPEVKRP